MEEINWYSKKIGKTVEEFDMFDKYITDVLKEFVKEQKEAINYTRCCTELKAKKGTDFEEFCSEHFIYKNSNTYSKESGLPVSLNDMLQKYKDLKT